MAVIFRKGCYTLYSKEASIGPSMAFHFLVADIPYLSQNCTSRAEARSGEDGGKRVSMHACMASSALEGVEERQLCSIRVVEQGQRPPLILLHKVLHFKTRP